MKMSYPETGGGWKKHGSAPVFGGRDTGTCFDAQVMHDDTGFMMHFSWRPEKALAFTRSADGVKWSEPRIFMRADASTGWTDDLNRSCAVKREGKWYIWYTGQAHGHSWIGCALSDDGVAWSPVSDQPVIYSERAYEGAAVMNPFVIWDEEKHLFRMWYAAGEQFEPNVIAYAVSEDGILWDKLPANPVFVGFKEHPYERDRVGACHIVKADGWHYMFYIGYEDIDTARVCLARSRDGVTGWQSHPDNPIISPSEDGWDRDACYKPTVVRDEENKRWLLWYNGRRGSEEYIGLAIHEGLDLGFDR